MPTRVHVPRARLLDASVTLAMLAGIAVLPVVFVGWLCPARVELVHVLCMYAPHVGVTGATAYIMVRA